MKQDDLQHLTVMVTRPKPGGEVLCEKIQQAGGHAIFFPTIDIVPLTHSVAFAQAIAELDRFDKLIFISPQAVYQTAAGIHARWPSFPSGLQVAAMGGGTALALQEAQLPVHLYPNEHWESEGLLALPDFQQVAKQKIAIIRGEGGREWLADELTRRGADIAHIIAYRRALPAVDVTHYLSLLKAQKIDIMTSTSNDILQNLIALLGKPAGPDLYAVPLVVVNARMAAFAKNKGFNTILVAKNASHDAIIAILKDHLCQMKLKKQ